MLYRVLGVAGAAAFILAAPASPLIAATFAQNAAAKPADKTAPTQPIDEYAQAERVLGSPAGDPECVWLGRRVVSLMWRDDLETAFRHLALYDRFKCPSAHVQAAFRCLVLHSASINPKAPDSLNQQVSACWLDPTRPVPPPIAPAAATAGKTTKR